jgi:O-methyltransferase domain
VTSATPKEIIGRGLQRVDFLLQSYFCLTRELYVDDRDSSPGAGMDTAEDWSRLRQVRTAPFADGADRYESDASYLRYLSTIHEGKVLSVLSLMKTFNFGSYGRILELGCGDMPQAYTICSKFPDISYSATDFDPKVIEKCARLPLLRGIRKSVLDVAHDDLSQLRNHDLVMSWSLEFSLEDSQLIRLFAASKKHSVPYLLASHTTIGPVNCLSTALSSALRRKPAKGSRMRMLGRLRSAGELARLAKQAGMTLRSSAFHVNHAVLFFVPA